jgi:hypothetical protein
LISKNFISSRGSPNKVFHSVSFLVGKNEKVLDYETYKKKHPESKQEIYNEVTDKTISGGWLRRTVDGMVKYAVNPATPTVGSNVKRDAVED